MSARKNRKLKHVALLVISSGILLFFLEMVFRMVIQVKPSLSTAPLPGEFAGIIQPDSKLFWSLKPNTRSKEPNGALVSINTHGLRGQPIMPKQKDEFRILSLGESTTYGAGVADDETYSALLAARLNDQPQIEPLVSVINAGVSAYSSFQGRIYLEHYGFDLDPDLVLIYFELNDYLPSSLRSFGFNETAAYLTDEELYHNNQNRWASAIVRKSKLLTWLSYKYAANYIKRLSAGQLKNPLQLISMDSFIQIPDRLTTSDQAGIRSANLNESNLGQRVSEVERYQNLAKFAKLCDDHDVRLVVIHPSYRDSKPHICLLTQFCTENNIPMIESHHVLHPNTNDHGSMFLDTFHPNKIGHEKLAELIADQLEPLLREVN